VAGKPYFILNDYFGKTNLIRSVNSTQFKGRELGSEESVDLAAGDVIQFGGVDPKFDLYPSAELQVPLSGKILTICQF
jgi:hypothetical protein